MKITNRLAWASMVAATMLGGGSTGALATTAQRSVTNTAPVNGSPLGEAIVILKARISTPVNSSAERPSLTVTQWREPLCRELDRMLPARPRGYSVSEQPTIEGNEQANAHGPTIV